MAEYVTLIEAAELEDVKYNTMVRRITRNPDKFDTMTEKLENGGKDAVLVAITSLSKKARNAWKERAKLKELSGTISPEGEAQPEPEAPWYVEADVDWYIENYREQWYKGMELGNVIREFLQYDGANKTEYAEQYAQEHLGSGKRTLYRYVKAYNEACAWADKLQKESGVGFEFFKVLCLCRKPKESGTFPSIKPEVKQVIKNIWFNEDFAANLGTREMLYEKLTLVANVNKWEKIPSYQTVTRYITYLMEDEGMKNAHFLASKGSREYKNKVMVKGSRDTSGLKVMQIVMGDEHTFDCWVAYKQPNGKVIPIKPHLAAWAHCLLQDTVSTRVPMMTCQTLSSVRCSPQESLRRLRITRHQVRRWRVRSARWELRQRITTCHLRNSLLSLDSYRQPCRALKPRQSTSPS